MTISLNPVVRVLAKNTDANLFFHLAPLQNASRIVYSASFITKIDWHRENGNQWNREWRFHQASVGHGRGRFSWFNIGTNAAPSGIWSGGVWQVAAHVSNPKLEIVRGDILDKELLGECMFECDSIIHLAAIVGYPACDKLQEEAVKVCLQACRVFMRRAGVR